MNSSKTSRAIEYATAFKRDYKREVKGKHQAILDAELRIVIEALQSDTALEPRYRDHDLGGNWSGYRDCHIKPDLVLIYSVREPGILRLVRLGSHAELFG